MHTYITRHGLGSGPNLSCTALYLTLLALVKAERTIGACVAAPSPSPAALAATLTRLIHRDLNKGVPQGTFGHASVDDWVNHVLVLVELTHVQCLT